MVLKDKVLIEEENLQDYQRRRKEKKFRNWKEKTLHGEFVQQLQLWLERRPGDDSGMVFKEGNWRLDPCRPGANLKNKFGMDNTSETLLCRLCRDSTDTVWHIFSGCRKLAQREYRKRHDKVALRVHWELCRKYELECNNENGATISPYQLQRIEKSGQLGTRLSAQRRSLSTTNQILL